MAGRAGQAVQFFHELQRFSDRFAMAEFGAHMRVIHGSARGRPWRGAVLHYTADQDPLRVVRWFRHGTSQVSAHLVICDRRLGSHERHAKGLPLVQALPVTVLQCRDPGQTAWHAGWANDRCYGIELVSAGMLMHNAEGELCTWRPRDATSPIWSDPWKSPTKDAVLLYGLHWEPYTEQQIAVTIMALRYLRDFGPDHSELEPAWVVGHDAVSQVKWDPGPAFPIHGVRSAVFDDWGSFRAQEWWTRYQTDPLDGHGWRDLAVARAIREQATGADNSRDPSGDVAWSRAWAAWSRLAEQTAGKQDRWVKLALYVLGYAVSGYAEGDFSGVELGLLERESVRIFQRMMALTEDGIVGPKTGAALQERLWDRFGVGKAGAPVA